MNTTSKKKLSLSFWLLVIGLIGLGIYSLISLRQTAAIYDGVLAMQANINSGSVKKVDFAGNDKPFNIPNWTLFRPGELWSLTSRDHHLPDGFETPELVNTEVAHGDSGQPMKVQKQIEAPLKALFDAAEKDGIELMLSSAYRSVDDQKQLYEQFVAEQGQDMAELYVVEPGASEHHTGLSVDFSTASAACEADSDKCSLAQDAAAWLFENGPRFGFIQRYPEGKQPLTGVAFEPWHYRYLGIPMAKMVAASGLTYDEIVRQVAPGYAR